MRAIKFLAATAAICAASVAQAQLTVEVTESNEGPLGFPLTLTFSVINDGVTEYDTIALLDADVPGSGIFALPDGVLGGMNFTSTFESATILGADLGLSAVTFDSSGDTLFGGVSSLGSTIISDASLLPILDFAEVNFAPTSNNNAGTFRVGFLLAGEVVDVIDGEFGAIPEPASFSLIGLAVIGAAIRRRR